MGKVERREEMNQRGIVDLALAIIIAGAVLIGSAIIAYKPQINCSVYTSENNQQPPEECKLASVPKTPTEGTTNGIIK